MACQTHPLTVQSRHQRPTRWECSATWQNVISVQSCLHIDIVLLFILACSHLPRLSPSGLMRHPLPRRILNLSPLLTRRYNRPKCKLPKPQVNTCYLPTYTLILRTHQSYLSLSTSPLPSLIASDSISMNINATLLPRAHSLTLVNQVIYSRTRPLIHLLTYARMHLLTHLMIHYSRTPVVSKPGNTSAAELSDAVSFLFFSIHLIVSFFVFNEADSFFVFCFPILVSLVYFAILALFLGLYALTFARSRDLKIHTCKS